MRSPAEREDLEYHAQQREAWILLDAGLSALDDQGLAALRDALMFQFGDPRIRGAARFWVAMLDARLASLGLDASELEYLAAYAAACRASHLNAAQGQYLDAARARLDSLASEAPDDAARINALAGIVAMASDQARGSSRTLALAVRRSDRLRRSTRRPRRSSSTSISRRTGSAASSCSPSTSEREQPEHEQGERVELHEQGEQPEHEQGEQPEHERGAE